MNEIKLKSPFFTIISLIPLDTETRNILFKDPSLLESFLERSIDSIKWSRRVAHVFNRTKIIKLRDIIQKLPKGKLLGYKNFGKKSYKEVINKIAKSMRKDFTSFNTSDLIITATKENKQIETLLMKGVLGLICSKKIDKLSNVIKNNEKIDQFLETPIEVIDWSVRNSNIFRKIHVKKMYDFSRIKNHELLSIKNFGERSLTEVFVKLDDFIDDFFNLTEVSKNGSTIVKPARVVKACDLEGLVKYMLSILSRREKSIFCKRYGLWDGKRKTLEELGQEFNLTRERIRQIQNKVIRKLRNRCWKNIIDHGYVRAKTFISKFLEEFCDVKIIPFIKTNFGIASRSELLQIIYSIDGGEIGADLANEFLSEVFLKGRSIFDDFVIKFDNNVVGLKEDDKVFYLKIIKIAKERLEKIGNPQSIKDILLYFKEKNMFAASKEGFIERCLLLSDISRDSLSKFGLEKWSFFNPHSIAAMAERALIEIGEPAHYTQITLLMNEMFPEYAPFNSHNVHARIGGIKKIFVWVGPGIFGLRRWGVERPPYIKDYLVKLLNFADEPLHLEKLIEKTVARCKCSKTSVSMTLDLNKNIFIKYPENFYGLIEWE